MNLGSLTIAEARRALDVKEYSALELTDAYLKNIAARDGEIHAYLEVWDREAREEAKKADAMIAAGNSLPLTGIPLAIKDNILIEGRIASAASKMLENYRATYDATVIKKLKAHGAVFLGRTNMDEFALGGSTENSAFGPTKNPHDTSRVPGGTSGGSAAAVAANMALAALGSDTGGSVRNPASFCGVVGLKPTYGAVSRSGLIAAASSFDQIGPLTKTVADAELLFNAIRGHDPLDSTSIDETFYPTHNERKIIGIPEVFWSNRDNFDVGGVGERFHEMAEALPKKGYTLVTIKKEELPSLEPALAAYYIINFAEVSTNLARFDGIRYGLSVPADAIQEVYMKTRGAGFGSEVRRRIMLGTYVLSAGYYDAFYNKAVAVRRQLQREYEKVFEKVDVIVTPTMPTPAWKVGEKSDPISAYLADFLTVPANLTGTPAISVPMGEVEREGKKLPTGFQIIAPHQREDTLLTIGRDVEAAA